MQIHGYKDSEPQRRSLLALLSRTVQKGELAVQARSNWVQLTNSQEPHVMLAIHNEDAPTGLQNSVASLLERLNQAIASTGAATEALFNEFSRLLDANPRHHIQL